MGLEVPCWSSAPRPRPCSDRTAGVMLGCRSSPFVFPPRPSRPEFSVDPSSLLDLAPARVLRPGLCLAGRKEVIEVSAFWRFLCSSSPCCSHAPLNAARAGDAAQRNRRRDPAHLSSRRRCHVLLRWNNCFPLSLHLSPVLKRPPQPSVKVTADREAISVWKSHRQD